MGFNQCYLRSVKDLESELESNGLELFVKRYRKYDSLTGSSESFEFLEQKIKEVSEYCERYNLKYDEEYFYPFRDHDKLGRGVFNQTISYEKGKYYKDWHCDANPENENSFGLGIWPKGNTPIKVKIEDWGVEVKDYKNGKARVWGFEII